jgi:hypothetical protein
MPADDDGGTEDGDDGELVDVDFDDEDPDDGPSESEAGLGSDWIRPESPDTPELPGTQVRKMLAPFRSASRSPSPSSALPARRRVSTSARDARARAATCRPARRSSSPPSWRRS